MFGLSRKWTVILILVLLGAGYHFFGPSSLDAMRQKRALKKTKTLVEKIVNNAKKKDQAFMNGNHGKPPPTGLKYGGDTSADIMPLGDLQGKNAPKTSVSKTTAKNRAQDEDADAPAAEGTLPTIPATKDVYYPPPSDPRSEKAKTKPRSDNAPSEPKPVLTRDQVFGEKGTLLEAQSKHPRDDPDATTGVYVSFSGTKVFTTDENGNKVPAKDGYYNLPNSNYRILIQNGKKTMDY